MTTVTLAELLKDTAYKLSQFQQNQIQALKSAISIKDAGKKPAPYVTCLVRGKPIKLTPEEASALENKARGSQSQERDVFHAPPVAVATGRVSDRKPARWNETASVICERIQATALMSLG